MKKYKNLPPLSEKTPNENMLILAFNRPNYKQISSKLKKLEYEVFKSYEVFDLILIGKIDSSLPSDEEIDNLKKLDGVKNVERNYPKNLT